MEITTNPTPTTDAFTRIKELERRILLRDRISILCGVIAFLPTFVFFCHVLKDSFWISSPTGAAILLGLTAAGTGWAMSLILIDFIFGADFCTGQRRYLKVNHKIWEKKDWQEKEEQKRMEAEELNKLEADLREVGALRERD